MTRQPASRASAHAAAVDPARKPALDLSRRSPVVPGPGLLAAGAGLALRTRTRRLLRLGWRVAGWAVAAAAVAWLVSGRVPAIWRLGALDALALGAHAALLLARLWRRLRRVDPVAALVAEPDNPSAGIAGRSVLEGDLELAALAITAVYVVLALTGAGASPLYPLLYLVVALLMIGQRPSMGVGGVALALALELALGGLRGDLAARPEAMALHGGFVTAFAAFYHAALASGLWRARSTARLAVQQHVSEMHERAQLYRARVSTDVDGDPADREDQRAKAEMASVAEMDTALHAVLEIAEAALRPGTGAVWFLTEDDKQLWCLDLLSTSDATDATAIPAGEGLLGAVLRRREPVRLHGRFRGVTWYAGGPHPQAFLGVPLFEGHREPLLRGVLMVDRLEGEPFTEDDERLLTVLGRELMRRVALEHLVASIRKEKDEKAHFFEAIKELNQRSKTDEICDELDRQVRKIASLDMVAVTLAEGQPDEGVRHRVVRAQGAGAEALVGQEFEAEGSLVSQVVGRAEPAVLPARDFHAMQHPVVFRERGELKGLQSLKIFPLHTGGVNVGTVLCGSREKHAFSPDQLGMLETVAIQAANAIQRGRLFEQTERLATIDGLTGLNNHRRFQERLEEVHAQARRYGHRYSLLLTDVDHFKSVNDTYGHPVGDHVLKGIAKAILSEIREADVAARYGGEEFAVILPETDAGGAKVIAERIRLAVAAQTFRTELGPLRATLSVGIATFPGAAAEKQGLIDKADQALYAAKHAGRNRVAVA